MLGPSVTAPELMYVCLLWEQFQGSKPCVCCCVILLSTLVADSLTGTRMRADHLVALGAQHSLGSAP